MNKNQHNQIFTHSSAPMKTQTRQNSRKEICPADKTPSSPFFLSTSLPQRPVNILSSSPQKFGYHRKFPSFIPFKNSQKPRATSTQREYIISETFQFWRRQLVDKIGTKSWKKQIKLKQKRKDMAIFGEDYFELYCVLFWD
jgi:hypothetical protein